RVADRPADLRWQRTAGDDRDAQRRSRPDGRGGRRAGHQCPADLLLRDDGPLLARHTVVVAAGGRLPDGRSLGGGRARRIPAARPWPGARSLPWWRGPALGVLAHRYRRRRSGRRRVARVAPSGVRDPPLPRRAGDLQACRSGAAPGDLRRSRRCAAGADGAAAARPSAGYRGGRRRRPYRTTSRAGPVHPPASGTLGGTAMNAWTVILAAGLGSFLFRLSMIVLFGRITMPAYLQRASELVAPAAFAAMAAAGLATACMSLGATRAAAPLAAVAAAVIAVLR